MMVGCRSASFSGAAATTVRQSWTFVFHNIPNTLPQAANPGLQGESLCRVGVRPVLHRLCHCDALWWLRATGWCTILWPGGESPETCSTPLRDRPSLKLDSCVQQGKALSDNVLRVLLHHGGRRVCPISRGRGRAECVTELFLVRWDSTGFCCQCVME